jgi:hypothetical protein
MPETGELLADKYRLGRLIGEGGMGAVYEAEHEVIGKRVAIKILKPHLVANAEAAGRFTREARAAAAQHAIGSATSAGTSTLSSALSDVPGGQVISQVVGAAAQIGQAALSRRDAPRASRAASSLGGGHSAASRSLEGILDAVSGAGDATDTEQAQVHFESDELADVTWSVDRLELTEALCRPYEARLELRTEQMDTEPSRLLGSNATALIERGGRQQRRLGIISEVLEGNATGDYLAVHLTIVPARCTAKRCWRSRATGSAASSCSLATGSS